LKIEGSCVATVSGSQAGLLSAANITVASHVLVKDPD
jgi:hypothetical protein